MICSLKVFVSDLSTGKKGLVNSLLTIFSSERLVDFVSEMFIDSFYSCTLQLDVIESFIRPTNAQLNCFKILKFTPKFTINASTCFGLTKSSSGSLQSVLR
jgi:hypothetical protein